MCILAATPQLISVVSTLPRRSGPPMDGLMAYGFLCAFFTLVFFVYQRESPRMKRAFAICLAATALYGFLQGVWPMGLVLLVLSIAAFRRPLTAKQLRPVRIMKRQAIVVASNGFLEKESRINRLFGLP